MEKVFVTKREDIPEGKGRTYKVKGKPVLITNTNGEFIAYRNFCPHMGGPLRFKGKDIVCEWHAACFDLMTGEAKTSPALGGDPLQKIIVSVEGDDIFCEIEEEKASPWANDF